jgi:cell division protein FtsZ
MEMVKKSAIIKVLGIGGGGGNMVSHMFKNGINEEVELILINTDIQVLNKSAISKKISIGSSITKGLGAGMKPEVGKNAAIETIEEIKKELEGTDMLFIAAGLGGGTGTGASSVIAKIAKEMGILTISIVTVPFNFEGNKRKKLAMEGMEELRQYSDSIIVIQNEKLIEMSNKNIGIKDSFKLVDDILMKSVMGITEVILNHNEDDINLDFADVQTIMSYSGKALIGIGESSGDNAATDSLNKAINSPLLEKHDFKNAKGLLIHFNINPNFPLLEINKAMNFLEEQCNEDIQIIFGTTTNESLKIDEVKIIVLATGFEEKRFLSDNIEDLTINIKNSFEFKNNLDLNRDFDSAIELDKPTWLRQQSNERKL